MCRIRNRRGNPSTGKIKEPNQCEVKNTDLSSPIFSFYQMKNKDYCLDCCQPDEKISLIQKLYELSQSTWQELKNAHRHGCGCEKIAHNAIKATIPDHIKEQDITLLAFRFHQKAPIVGYREKQVFHILWIDRAYVLYYHC